MWEIQLFLATAWLPTCVKGNSHTPFKITWKMLQAVALCFLTVSTVPIQGNPDLPWNQTWMIINAETGEVANVTSNLVPQGTWFPDLHVDLCDLVGDAWDPSDQEPFPGYGCKTPGGRSNTRSLGFYVCPAHSRDRKQIAKCGGPESAYCKAWGCESTGWITWTPPITGDLISVERSGNTQEVGRGYCQQNGKRVNCGSCYNKDQSGYSAFPLATPGGRCNPLVIKFTPAGKKANWEAGKTWGLRLYRSGYDPGLIFTIKLVQRPLSKTALGPNQVLNPSRQSVQQTSTPKPRLTHFSTTFPDTKTLPPESVTFPAKK